MKRVYAFKYSVKEKHYTADAFAVRCVDDRFWKSFKRFLHSLGVRRVDPKSPAGGAKVFVPETPKAIREHYLNEILISVRLHHVKTVFLFTHHDCGGYGGFAKFGNDKTKELSFHAKELKKARRVVQKRFPDLTVKTYFIDDEGIMEIS